MLSASLSKISDFCGVYIFKDGRDEIIYIGKAKNLKKRVSSYFQRGRGVSPKTSVLVKSVAKIETIVVDNEVEALLLENTLIKKHKPKYNINLKDSKTYAYIKITDERIPKLVYARRVLEKGSYFGPYPFGTLRRKLFDMCRKLYGIMTPSSFSSKSDVNFEIGLVPARREEDVNLKRYYENVKKAKQFLLGKNLLGVRKELERKMFFHSKNLEFERANYYKNLLCELEVLFEEQKVLTLKSFNQDVVVFKVFGSSVSIFVLSVIRGVVQNTQTFHFDYEDCVVFEFVKRYYGTHLVPKEILTNSQFWEGCSELEVLLDYLGRLSGSKVSIKVPQRGEKRRLVELALKNLDGKSLLEEICEVLSLSRVPKIIECFDISNLGREFVVGAMTRWVDGIEQPSQHRKFEIRSFVNRQDDFKAMREVISRRYMAIKKNKGFPKSERSKSVPSVFPDLIVVDGGLGHLKISCDTLRLVGVEIPIIALAKKNEEIFVPSQSGPLIFDKSSEMMLFLRKVRDSTHGYAVRYNRKKRQMKLNSEL